MRRRHDCRLRVNQLEQPTSGGLTRCQILPGGWEWLHGFETREGGQWQECEEDAVNGTSGHERNSQHEHRQPGEACQQPPQPIAHTSYHGQSLLDTVESFAQGEETHVVVRCLTE